MVLKEKLAQMKIQQMAFLILAVMFFFALVGLFILRISLANLEGDFSNLNKEQAITSIQVVTSSTELNCNSREELCLDEDKLQIMSGDFKEFYSSFWPVAFIKVYKYSAFNSSPVKCPSPNCNHYEVHNNGQEFFETRSSIISICKKSTIDSSRYESCEVGRIEIGILENEE